MTNYNKLVRDNIIDIMKSKGLNPKYKTLNDKQYLNELNKKLVEETNEYLFDGEVEELADVMEVIYAILKFKKIKLSEFNKLRNDKAKKRGKFNKKLFLESDE